MNQIAFYIGSKPIHWYGVCIAVGFLLATGLLLWKRTYARMSRDQIFDVAMIAIFAGIVGARVFYVIEFWNPAFSGRPFWNVFRIDQGGIVFYGGFIAAFVSLCIYAKHKSLSILRMLDLTAPAIALAHACGRIGCFLQGCCFGGPASKGFPGAVCFPFGSAPAKRYPDIMNAMNSVPLYPVQVYECILNLFLCAGLVIFLGKNNKPGRVASLYIVCYAIIRFSLEFLRGDHRDSFLGMTPSQNIALFLMLPLGLALYFVFSRGCRISNKDNK